MDEIFIYQPQETSEEPRDVTCKLAVNTLWSYKILATYKDAIAIEVDGLRDIVSRDRVTKFPEPLPRKRLQQPPIAHLPPQATPATKPAMPRLPKIVLADRHSSSMNADALHLGNTPRDTPDVLLTPQ